MSEDTRKILKKLEVGTTYSGVDVICRQYKEIERLKSRLEEYQEYVEINHKEIERLENIINELEKYLKKYSNDLEFRCYANIFLEYLQVLKGSDK